MSGLEKPISGENLVRKAREEGQKILPLTNSIVQVVLAKQAFPGMSDAMDKWLEGGDSSLSSRCRAYIEDPIRAEGEQVDVNDEHAVAELLEAVKRHSPETVH